MYSPIVRTTNQIRWFVKMRVFGETIAFRQEVCICRKSFPFLLCYKMHRIEFCLRLTGTLQYDGATNIFSTFYSLLSFPKIEKKRVVIKQFIRKRF